MTTTLAYSTEILPLQSRMDSLRRKPGFYAAAVVLGATLLLYPLKYLDPYTATLIIGPIAAAAVILAVLIKQEWRPHLNLESIVFAGMTIQHFIAPTLLRFLSEDFEIIRNSSERRAVHDAYAPAMLIVLLYMGVFLLVSACFKPRFPPRFSDGRLASAFTLRSFVVFGVLLAQLWLIRYYLVITGSFYHIHRTRFQYDDSRYSGWAQYSEGVGPVVLAFFWGAFWMGRARLWWILLYTLMDFGYQFISGSRQRTLTVPIVILITYFVYIRRVPLKIPFAGIIGFMDLYRYAIRDYAETNRISLYAVVTAINRATEISEKQGIDKIILGGVGRLNGLEPLCAIVLWVPQQQPYLNGETYERIIPAFVPRFMWKDKPFTTMTINEWFFRREGGSSGVTNMGEGYLNFGIVGVILAAALYAIVVRGVDNLIVGFLRNSAVLPVYVGTMAILAYQHHQPYSVILPSMVKILMLVILVHLLTRPGRDNVPVHPNAYLGEPGYA
jgi:hypothetical protein